MTKIPKGKTILYVYIDEDLNKQLRTLIIKKYGEYRRGLLSAEVENALRVWLSTHKSTQTQELTVLRPANPIPKYWRVFQECKKFIEQRYGVDFKEVYQIPLKFMVEAIQFTRGSDKRTVRKWLRVFEEQHLIKFISPGVIEVLG